jgi:hypothetical protein
MQLQLGCYLIVHWSAQLPSHKIATDANTQRPCRTIVKHSLLRCEEWMEGHDASLCTSMFCWLCNTQAHAAPRCFWEARTRIADPGRYLKILVPGRWHEDESNDGEIECQPRLGSRAPGSRACECACIPTQFSTFSRETVCPTSYEMEQLTSLEVSGARQ